MKVTYIEQIEHHAAFSRKMYCPACGAHEYEIVRQLEPENFTPWFIRCPQCGAEGLNNSTRDLAIAWWKHNYNINKR